MPKKIVIIGGGVSGLAAGVNALKNGYDALILEKNPVPGGLCTSWKRKGFEIDGCIHWLTGTNPNTMMYQTWRDLGAIKEGEEFIYLDSWGSYHYEDTTVTFYRDLDKTEEEWIKISPKDKRQIKHFIRLVRRNISVELPLDKPAALLPFKVKMKFVFSLLRHFPLYFFPMMQTCERYAKKFKHPALRWAIEHAQPGAGNLYSMIFSYGTIANNNGGIPYGGSKTLVSNLLETYTQLGGQIRYNSEVTSFNIEKKKITSLNLSDGSLISGDYYITCCDSNYVLFNLLDNKYVHRKLAERYNKPISHPAPSCVFINYAVNKDVKINIPYNFKVEGFKLAEKTIDHINMRIFNYDDDFVRGERTVLQVLLDQDSNDYNYWQELYKDKEKYCVFKQKLGEYVWKLIYQEVPEFGEEMNLLDVATPVTFARYTNASRGTYMSFLFNHQKGTIASRGRVSGITNLMLSGQYVQTPGGLPLAMASGKFSVDWIKHYELGFFPRIFNLFRN